MQRAISTALRASMHTDASTSKAPSKFRLRTPRQRAQFQRLTHVPLPKYPKRGKKKGALRNFL
eukprot:2225809-Amphidinium_carterae.1